MPAGRRRRGRGRVRGDGGAVCCWAERWAGELRADGEETRELGFFALDSLPQPLHRPSSLGLAMFEEHLRSGGFQVS